MSAAESSLLHLSPQKSGLVSIAEIEARIERRREWRDGFDAGVKVGAARFFASPVLEQIAFELKLQRAAAESLGRQADYWKAKADEFELIAEHWYDVVVDLGAAYAAAS